MAASVLAGIPLKIYGCGCFLLVGVFLLYIFSASPPIFSNKGIPVICKNKPLNSSFPQRIHQIWKEKNLPGRWKKAAEHCKTLYPSYEYKLWTDSELKTFITSQYSWFLPIYQAYPYDIQRVDASKYFLLHHFGGIYLDMDVSCSKSFESYLQNLETTSKEKDIVLRWTDPQGIGIEIMVAKARSQFIEYIIQQLGPSQRSYGIKYATVMFTTGPYWCGDMYGSYPCKDVVQIVPEEYFTDIYFIHHHNSGWHGWDGTLITVIYYHYIIVLEVICTLSILLVFVMLLRSRRKYQSQAVTHETSQ